MKKLVSLIGACLLAIAVSAQQKYLTVSDIAFTAKTDAYSQERLKLDVYYPEGASGCPVVVWFHGGGLEAGQKELGYLSLMLCLNKAWLQRYDVDADSVWLYAPFSGQAITHYNVRKMQGIGPLQPTIDEYAPLYWVRPNCPPLVLICGDRELELFGRYDENQYLARMMKLVGHRQTYLYELDGHGHGGMIEPGYHILETHIKTLLGQSVNP